MDNNIKIIEEQKKELNMLRLQLESVTNERDYILGNFRGIRKKLSSIENSKGYKILELFRKIIRKILRRG